MPDRFDIEIGGADVEVRVGTLNITEIINGRNTLKCEVQATGAPVRPANGEEVIAEDNSTRIFGGNVSMPSEHVIDGQLIDKFATTVNATDFNAIADRRSVINGAFPAGFTLKQAATSLVGYLAADGVTLDPSQVDGPVLPLMGYDVKRVSGWFDELSVITGFIWEIDYNKVLRFKEPGADPAPFDIADGDGNTVGDIVVEPSDADYANRVIVLAGTGQREMTQALTFNGSDDFIDLTYTLVGHRGYLTVNGVNETLGGSPAIWVFDSVIPNRIKREAGAPSAGVGEIIYTAQFPYIAQADDVAEQAGPRGIVDTVIRRTDVFEATLAQAIAAGYLVRTVEEPRTIRYPTHTAGLHPGMAQHIQSSVRDIDLDAFITEVRAHDIDGETMRYEITAIEGDVYTGSWRDMYREWGGVGGGATSSASGPITVVTSGGVGGSGTAGTLAQWVTTATIGDATAVPASLLTGTIAAARMPQFTGGDVVTSGAGSVALAIQAGAIFNVAINASAAIAWTKIDKSGSSLADLTTRSAGDLSSGNLAYARMPSGSGTWTASPTISGATVLSSTLAVTGVATFTNDVDPANNYTSNLGALDKKYLTLHAAELWVETLVAQNTIATIGGRILVGPTTTLTADLASGGTTITVKHNQIANGDRLYMEADGKVEFMAVTSGAGGSAGAYTYTVTRNLDGSGANDWFAGDAVFNTGTTGDGFIDLYSVSGVLSGAGPTIVMNVRTGTTYNNIATRAAFGNLNGHYGIATDLYGVAMGDPSGANIVIDATNGLRIRTGTTDYAVLASSLFRLGLSSGNRVEWDGSDLTVVANTVGISSSGITVEADTSTDTWTELNGFTFSGLTTAKAGLATREHAYTVFEQYSTLYQELSTKWAGTNHSRYVATLISAYSNPTGGDPSKSAQLYVEAGVSTSGASGTPVSQVRVLADLFKVAGGSLAGNAEIDGTLQVDGFGTHAFSSGGTGSNEVKVENTTSGTVNTAFFGAYNNVGLTGYLQVFSSTFSTSGPNVANAMLLGAGRAGGISIAATDASGEIRFYVGGSTMKTKIDANGDYIPATDGQMHVGVPSKRFAYMTALAFNLTDMSLDNGWSLTESYRLGIAEPGVALVDDVGQLIAFFGKDALYTKNHRDVDSLKYHVTTLAERLEMDPTPEIRIKEDGPDGPRFKTAADVRPMPNPALGQTNSERRERG